MADCVKSNLNVRAYGHLDDTTGAVWRHILLFSVVFLRLKNLSLFAVIVLECFVEHFTQPSICIVVSR